MSESIQLFIRRIGLVGFAQAIISLKGIILLPIITKMLGASEYGIWAFVLVIVSLFSPLIILGLDNANLRFLASKPKNQIFQGVMTSAIVILFTSIIASIILFFFSDFFAVTFLKDIATSNVIKLTSLYIILNSLNTILLCSFRVFGLIKSYSAILILKTYVEVGLIIGFIVLGFGVYGAVIALIIASLLSLVIMSVRLVSHAGFTPPDFSLLRPHLQFGIPLIPISLSLYVLETSDRFVVGFYLGAEKMGIYSAAYNIGIIPLMFSTLLVFILGPTVYNLYDKGNTNKVNMYLSYSWKYLLMILIPCAFGLGVLAKPLLSLMTSSIFISEGQFIIPLVAVGIVFWGAEQIFGVSLWIFKKTKIFIIGFVIASAANLILNIILVPYFGIIAAAVTTLAAYIILAVIIGYNSRKYIPFNLHIGFLIKSLIASSIMVCCLWIMNPRGVLALIGALVIGVLIYFFLLYVQRGFKKGELQVLFDAIGLKKKHNTSPKNK